MPTFYEFFAGGGMVRAGLSQQWECLLANDCSVMKTASYARNWGDSHLVCADVATLTSDDIPGCADLSWASFPCQDLSLAGTRAGLNGSRSGAFWPFWRLMCDLAREERAPKIILLENVYGALHSHAGKDFAAIASAITHLGYRFGALVIDAERFVPQSRKRLFIIALRPDIPLDGVPAITETPNPLWLPEALVNAYRSLSAKNSASWVWWNLPEPKKRQKNLSDILEEKPTDITWHSEAKTAKLLGLMNAVNRKKVTDAQSRKERVVAGVYIRTRKGKQRAEVRTDNISGCLRTPAGGSSRQTLLFIEGAHIRSRLLSRREAARLMGLSDEYELPKSYTDAYHLAGDGVAVDVVKYLARHIFEPLLEKVATEVAFTA